MNDMIQIRMIIDSWSSTVKRTDTLFEKLTDEELLNEVAPNRNRGIYLLGHLAAVHDMMLPLLNFGESLYSELKTTFIGTPDNPEVQNFSITELRQYWTAINAELQKNFDKLTVEEWLEKHNSVSEEDFAKEPHRNKLNVVLGRTKHMDYHLGQLAFLKN